MQQRPTFQARITGLVSGRKLSCGQVGPCHGYSDPCAQECFKAIGRDLTRGPSCTTDATPQRQVTLLRTTTDPESQIVSGPLENLDEEGYLKPGKPQRPVDAAVQPKARCCSAHSHPNGNHSQSGPEHDSYDAESNRQHGGAQVPVDSIPPKDPSQAHHHHVPTNAFLSIGLQTSIAIALHKLPEGFITYATNHANPKLGFSVFMALFIHNITEGFAMALPLYLAISSRWKAMFWSSLLGGVSQPLGAGIAALWFKAAGNGDNAPGHTVYGCMFAITAGIMASVALQLFSESLGLTHNRSLCITFAFLGMGILGISFALTAG